jgi:peptidoglycan/LPS O-acetylase OafA/YrhL
MKRRFHTLDGLRGIAAIGVLARHASGFFPIIPHFETYLAVDFFFVLSGFVLAHSYGERLRSEIGPIRFLILRLIRLYPLYILAVIVAVLVPNRFSFAEIAFAIFLLPALTSNRLLFPLNGPSWSIFFEIVANLFYAAISRYRAATKIFVAICAMSAALLVAGVVFDGLGFGQHEGAMDAGFLWSSLPAGFIRVGYSFFAGLLVYDLYRRNWLKFEVPPVVLILVLALILMVHPKGDVLQSAFDLIAALAGFPILVWVGANCSPSPAAARIYSFLGFISYPIYILQLPLVRAAYTSLDPKLLPPVTTTVTSLCIMIVIAFVVARYFDAPLRRMLSSLRATPPAIKAKI